MQVIAGYCVALDLTARDLQTNAKDKGLPWCVPKGYDHFTPVGCFLEKGKVPEPHGIELYCLVNGVQRQRGSTADMIFQLPQLVAEIRRSFWSACGCLTRHTSWCVEAVFHSEGLA